MPKRPRNLTALSLFLPALALAAAVSLFKPHPVWSEPKNTRSAPAPIIRSIRIEVVEIFDEPDIGRFYRTVNKLKAGTREEVVRRELLFEEGEPFDSFLLEESERNLRRLPFLRQISITPVHDGRYVDLMIQVQDTWTLFPFITLSSRRRDAESSDRCHGGQLAGIRQEIGVLGSR